MIRVGTRASTLARTQSQLVADALARTLGEDCELVLVSTHGDRSAEPLRELARDTGGTGVFVSALRDALLAGQVDVAVHSLKDLPTAPFPGIDLAAVPEREDPRDALVSVGGTRLVDLPDGARVGTGSPRRAAMLAVDAARRGRSLRVVDVRGNVDTRMGRVGVDLDAVVLALAGLRRLGRDGEVSDVLGTDVLLPAPGQGALAVETRSGDPLGARVRDALDHAPTRAAVTAERTMLRVLDAGCSAPVGALATVSGEEVVLHAALADDPVADAADVGVAASATAPRTASLTTDRTTTVLDGPDVVPRLLRLRQVGAVADAASLGERAGHELLRARLEHPRTDHEETLR
ncbi:hydroxymethylbilane synthase [Aquipuribacter sp. MA13-6]|uniref:hydroxymethylbilane synthase n=1 Tax=unclassified Aquipuribacter TaxID=2635084 RepID=UPI003EEF317A